MYRKANPSICCLLIFAFVIVIPISNAQAAGCWKEATFAAVNESCAPCSMSVSCPTDTADVISAYDYCKPTGTGVSGRCECWVNYTDVGDWYDCETNWNVIAMLGCAAALGVCAIQCVVAGPTCGWCLAGVGTGCAASAATCGFVDSCDKDMDSATSIYRYVFDALEGMNCTGP